MSTQLYLIDTNVLIGVEDNHAFKPAYSNFSQLAAKHKVDVFFHESASDDIRHDGDPLRRRISLSKLEKFQRLEKVDGLTKEELERTIGRIRKPNDFVDATPLHALGIGAAHFLATEDQGCLNAPKDTPPTRNGGFCSEYVVVGKQKNVKSSREVPIGLSNAIHSASVTLQQTTKRLPSDLSEGSITPHVFWSSNRGS